VKTVEMAEATAPLSEYARKARRHALVVTQKGRPILALVSLPPHTDLENLAVTTHATFQAIIRRAEKRYRAEGGLSTAQVRRQLAARRAATRKR
jgi:antitoxin (DNA-binding transcriptional repressor) of toxin-antitoxin stability system